jgi:hypothetical protein
VENVAKEGLRKVLVAREEFVLNFVKETGRRRLGKVNCSTVDHSHNTNQPHAHSSDETLQSILHGFKKGSTMRPFWSISTLASILVGLARSQHTRCPMTEYSHFGISSSNAL